MDRFLIKIPYATPTAPTTLKSPKESESRDGSGSSSSSSRSNKCGGVSSMSNEIECNTNESRSTQLNIVTKKATDSKGKKLHPS